MSESDKENVQVLLEWRDAALRTCPNLGMYGNEFGAYILLCRDVDHVPEIGGIKRPDLLLSPDPCLEVSP